MSQTENNPIAEQRHSDLKAYAEQLLDIYKSEDLSVRLLNRGSCMRPIIESGDSLDVLPNVQNYLVGDIVVFRIQGELVVHRIVDIFREMGELRFITKGDMMLRCDKPIGKDEIYGKVVRISKAKGRHKTDCAKLATLFSTIARFSLKFSRLNEFVHSYCGRQSSTALCRLGNQLMRMWIGVFYILIKTAVILRNLK